LLLQDPPHRLARGNRDWKFLRALRARRRRWPEHFDLTAPRYHKGQLARQIEQPVAHREERALEEVHDRLDLRHLTGFDLILPLLASTFRRR